MNHHRRLFLLSACLATVRSLTASTGRRPRILLRSSWQTVNIGDIAHTPGLLHLLESHLPGADVTLWASDTSDGVKEMLLARFPKLSIVHRGPEVARAIDGSDFLLHGSGPYLVAQRDVARWRQQTQKPYGVFGISLPELNDTVRDHLSRAEFVFFRDTVSLRLAQNGGVRCPLMAFGPDAAFAVDLRNEKAADSFLEHQGLRPGKFLCCIPRYRHTPYWNIKNRPLDQAKHRRNEQMKEHDHAPLRAAIVETVRSTGLKVLLCPEDQTQMALGKEMLLDKLPPDVVRHVVWREKFWLTDEAVSVYRRSAGLFGLEMHSPIMCIGNGVPAIVGRFAEQGSKGYMWRDIGLGDWLIDMDDPKQVQRIVPLVLAMASRPQEAKERARRAQAKVARLHANMVATVRKALP